MPYINQSSRPLLRPTSTMPAQTVGELNFQVSTLIARYLELEKVSYARLNDVIGVLEAAKLEVYRRLAAPYEDKKIAENGDVYPRTIGGYNA